MTNLNMEVIATYRTDPRTPTFNINAARVETNSGTRRLPARPFCKQFTLRNKVKTGTYFWWLNYFFFFGVPSIIVNCRARMVTKLFSPNIRNFFFFAYRNNFPTMVTVVRRRIVSGNSFFTRPYCGNLSAFTVI